MKKLFFLIQIVLLFSCRQENQLKSTILFDEIESSKFDLKISELIPLETNNWNLLGNHLDVRFNSDQYWILDFNNPDAIHGFSANGKSLKYVAEVGEGPNRLFNIRDFYFTDSLISVLSNLGDKVEVSQFTRSNKLVWKDEIESNGFSIISQDGTDFWLYSGYNQVAGKYRLRHYNRDGQLQNEFLENDFRDDFLPFLEPSFFYGDDRILFKETLKQKIYEIKDGQLTPIYTLDFGALNVPQEIWGMETIQAFEKINSNGFATIQLLAESKKYFLIDVLIQKEGTVSKSIIIINKDSHEVKKYELENNNSHLTTPFRLEGNKIGFISYSGDFVNKRNELNLSNTDLDISNSITENDNPVIFYAEIDF